MMRKCFFFVLCLPVLLSSCFKSQNKECTYGEISIVATNAEITFLQNYTSTNAIPAIQHYSGIFYTIQDGGSGPTPSVCSNVALNYSGSLLSNGNVFESNNLTAGTSFVLGQLIVGLQKGLGVLKSGGRMTIYIPPSLGYGSNDKYNDQGQLAVPANSYLKFTVHLLDVY